MLTKRQTGLGLIEVLVALLILTIGILGLAGLQGQSLKFNNDSLFRTQATLLAMDMADRMRANLETVRSTPNAYKFLVSETVPASPKSCETAACTPAELAQYDFYEWKQKAQAVLPGAQVSVTTDASGSLGQTYVIEIGYQGSAEENAQTMQYRVRI